MPSLLPLIVSPDPAIRDQSLDALCRGVAAAKLVARCGELDAYRRRSDNLYERVRALFFLYAIHRFHLPQALAAEGIARGGRAGGGTGLIPFRGYEQLLARRFEEAIETFLVEQETRGPSDAICSALAAAYHRLAFQTLADQVRRSVRSVRGNQWMFRMGHPADQPLRLRPELLQRNVDGTYPILREETPVRMDLTHSAWSDIFFLGMDFPEGARVLNVSVDLGVHGRDSTPRPPVSAWLRVLDEPVLRRTSVDLVATEALTSRRHHPRILAVEGPREQARSIRQRGADERPVGDALGTGRADRSMDRTGSLGDQERVVPGRHGHLQGAVASVGCHGLRRRATRGIVPACRAASARVGDGALVVHARRKVRDTVDRSGQRDRRRQQWILRDNSGTHA